MTWTKSLSFRFFCLYLACALWWLLLVLPLGFSLTDLLKGLS
jgi:hypothetical protein